MRKRMPIYLALLLLAAMVIINVAVPEPEEKHDTEYPMANANVTWEQSFHSGGWSEAE